MRVLLDGDILLECFLNKSDYIKEFNEILKIAKFIDWKVYVMYCCLEKVRFYGNKRSIQLGDNIAFQVALKFNNYCIIHVDSNLIEQAKKSPIQDFDSAIEMAWAIDNHLDAIITLEPKFFEKATKATIEILTLEELLTRIREKELVARIPFNSLSLVQVPTRLSVLEAVGFKQTCQDLIKAKPHLKKIIFDFHQTTFMDSSGLGALVSNYKLAQEKGITIILRDVTPQVMAVLTLTGLDQVFSMESSGEPAFIADDVSLSEWASWRQFLSRLLRTGGWMVAVLLAFRFVLVPLLTADNTPVALTLAIAVGIFLVLCAVGAVVRELKR